MVKDILKMTAKQRCEYLSFVNLDECNNELINYVYSMDLADRCEFTQLFNKSQKLMLGNNKSWECKKHSNLNYNILLIKLNVLMFLGHYEKFIKGSDKL
ncbi:MAG: hypothetical protein ACI4OP_07890 [Candidatus Coprovivens sp.]